MARFIAFLLLNLMMVTVISGVSTSQTNCTYLVKVETSCTMLAGTSDHVSLRFGDGAGNHVIAKHLKDPIEGVDKKPFGWCSSATFKVEGPCVNQSVCYLYVKRTGSDQWRPAKAIVSADMDPEARGPVDVFYFRRFIPNNVWHGYDYCDYDLRDRSSAKATSVHAKLYNYDHHEDCVAGKLKGRKEGKLC